MFFCLYAVIFSPLERESRSMRACRVAPGGGVGVGVALVAFVFSVCGELRAQQTNVAPAGIATQTSEYPCCGGFPAERAIDGDFGNFTATAADDQLMPAWFGTELAGLIPDASHLALDGGGHMLPETRGQELAAAISDFLAA